MNEVKCPKCGETFTVDEASYAAILQQVRNREFEAELRRRMQEREAQLTAERAVVDLEEKSARAAELSEKERTIVELRSRLDAADRERENGIRLAVLDERQKMQSAIAEKEKKIAELQSLAELEKARAEGEQARLREEYNGRLKAANEQVEFYRDFKARASTKMVGESLEVHCRDEFERIRPAFPGAVFGKDNDVVDNTKGDFVFRDFDDGVEYISIMFEMKNEMETTADKHKNEEFFKKLDADRRKKKCEYAVLVSMLEADSDYYNAGIVSVGGYEKMYVVRPQCFIPIIMLLMQAAKNGLALRRELESAKNRSVDISKFEEKVGNFKKLFSTHCKNAETQFENAIAEIDKSIKHLEDVKTALRTSLGHFDNANGRLDDLTIRKLTYGNPTMASMFAEARKAADAGNAEETAPELPL